MQHSYPGYGNALVQNPDGKYANVTANNLTWGTFLPLSITNPLLGNLVWNAPMHVNGSNTFVPDNMYWNAPTFADILGSAYHVTVPPTYNFPVPQFPMHQQVPIQAVSTGASPATTRSHSHMPGEPHFNPGYDTANQPAQKQLNRGCQAPSDAQVEISRMIIEIMTSVKVMPNQDVATLNSEIAPTREKLTAYLSSLPQDDYHWIENGRRKRIALLNTPRALGPWSHQLIPMNGN
ncbi:hypothetical protein BJ165DRAFT_1401361 [Panaeolus papilionaceus]|nr:hypothetical protein BJ165DRAFT_1401361 [Panaeolus papilionaceus]